MLAIVHNGVIENYQQIKARLVSEGYTFQSATDSEIIGHLISDHLEHASDAETNGMPSNGAAGTYAPLVAAVKHTLSQLRGTYGIVVLFRDHPDVLICARLGSPMVIGVGDGEHFVASDGYTASRIYRQDCLSRRPRSCRGYAATRIRVIHRDQGDTFEHACANCSSRMAKVPISNLAGYAHYMLKEIFERTAADSYAMQMRGRLEQRRRHGRLRRFEPHAPNNCSQVRAFCAHRLRHELACFAGG